jgi:hypothetical protein
MNEPLNHDGIMSLADDIIWGTPYEEYLHQFVLERGHKTKSNSIIEKKRDEIVGYGWYRAFLNRHADQLTRKRVRIRDHRTWCAAKRFFNMFEVIYKAMVDCGVAERLDREATRGKEGNEVDNPAKMYGRPSRYHMLWLDWCFFLTRLVVIHTRKLMVIMVVNCLLCQLNRLKMEELGRQQQTCISQFYLLYQAGARL